MKNINWYSLITMVLITVLAGVLSNLLSGDTKLVYASIVKPPLSPPGWLFGVVWPVLYLLMGVAAYIISQTPWSTNRKKAIILYWAQLLVNVLWPIVFFRFELYWVSVAVILVLDVLVFITALRFYKLEKRAGYLLLPYLLWILFATCLNVSIAVLN